MKVARNEKRKKLLGFSFYINTGNSEAFLWNLNLSANRLFWRCDAAVCLKMSRIFVEVNTCYYTYVRTTKLKFRLDNARSISEQYVYTTNVVQTKNI